MKMTAGLTWSKELSAIDKANIIKEELLAEYSQLQRIYNTFLHMHNSEYNIQYFDIQYLLQVSMLGFDPHS